MRGLLVQFVIVMASACIAMMLANYGWGKSAVGVAVVGAVIVAHLITDKKTIKPRDQT